jgi:hypothetical protein
VGSAGDGGEDDGCMDPELLADAFGCAVSEITVSVVCTL